MQTKVNQTVCQSLRQSGKQTLNIFSRGKKKYLLRKELINLDKSEDELITELEYFPKDSQSKGLTRNTSRTSN